MHLPMLPDLPVDAEASASPVRSFAARRHADPLMTLRSQHPSRFLSTPSLVCAGLGTAPRTAWAFRACWRKGTW
jgi:hypothetical protein